MRFEDDSTVCCGGDGSDDDDDDDDDDWYFQVARWRDESVCHTERPVQIEAFLRKCSDGSNWLTDRLHDRWEPAIPAAIDGLCVVTIDHSGTIERDPGRDLRCSR